MLIHRLYEEILSSPRVSVYHVKPTRKKKKKISCDDRIKEVNYNFFSYVTLYFEDRNKEKIIKNRENFPKGQRRGEINH